ncbi:hypothetical protein [Saccharopolyspora spinosa]|uniref:hypothetical protein n=1 Tax=Saccharopolyspora spinosa TaxID=60894 RepID=UPI0002379AB9|nr:hypothetical protein [Saccharopolyspora spinosa]
MAAAKLAARWTDAEVTLINAGDRFVERVRLHQLAAGQALRDLPLADLVEGTGVTLVVDRMTGIDATGQAGRADPVRARRRQPARSRADRPEAALYKEAIVGGTNPVRAEPGHSDLVPAVPDGPGFRPVSWRSSGQ